MAIDILFDPDCEHLTRYDLESFFYVLVFICAVFRRPNPDAPNKSVELDDSKKPQFILEWLYPVSAHNLASVKRGQLNMRIKEWRRVVSGQFQPYWNPLKNCIWRLKQIVAAEEATHEVFIDILRETLDSLPEDEDCTAGDDLTLPSGSFMTEGATVGVDNTSVGYESPTPAPGSSRLKRSSLPREDGTILAGNVAPKNKRSKTFHS